jgi:hypothetical protein
MTKQWAVVSGATSAALNNAILIEFANRKQKLEVVGFAIDAQGVFYALLQYNV